MVAVMHFRPDVILYITGQYIPTWVPALIRECFKDKIKQAVWYTESPYMIANEMQRAPLYDYIFTCDKYCEDRYQGKDKTRKRSFYLPTAYNSSYRWGVELRRWEKIIYSPEVCFVGSEVPGRLDFLLEVATYLKGKVDFKIFGAFPTIESGMCPDLKPFFIPITLNKEEVAKYYKGSSIVLNHFRKNESKRIVRNIKTEKSVVLDIEPYSLSPRIYEVWAAGGFILTDDRSEFKDIFGDGEMGVAIYEDAKECAEKITYYLAHEEERKRIAEVGHEAGKSHTYEDRVEKMVKILSEN